jgi:D-sedoheptulose 7-phosphate isomerase
LAAKFVGRFVEERCRLSAIALTTDTFILAAIRNDYGYNQVFRNSGNIVKAFEQAKQQGLHAIAFTGPKDSKMSAIADITLKVPAPVTARVQECHILVGHMICEYVDEEY